MFQNLIESSAQTEDVKRRGSFFVGTMLVYGMLFLAGGLASIYAYDAHLENQNLELVALIAPPSSVPEPRAASDIHRNNTPRGAAGSSNNLNRTPTSPALVSNDPTQAPDHISVEGNGLGPTPPNATVGPDLKFSTGGGGWPGDKDATGPGGGGSPLPNTAQIEPPEPPPAPTPKAKPIATLGVVNAMAIQKPAPPYPPLAKAAHVSGVVTVQIMIDEAGRVISAHVTSGHPLLNDAAMRAAYQARFTQTLLSGQPVKATGYITYNFILQ